MLRDAIELWVMVVRRKSGVKVSVKPTRRFLREVPKIRHALSCPLHEAIKERNCAFRVCKAVSRTEAIKVRQNFQGTPAKAIAVEEQRRRGN